MAIKIIQNTREAEQPPEAPLRDDGGIFTYGMHFDGGKYIAFADTISELFTALISNYMELDENTQLVERIKFALLVQLLTQSSINASVEEDDWNQLPNYEKDILTGSRDEQPHGWSIDEPLGDIWDSEVPLILVDTGYAPYTEIPRPVSVHGDYEETPNILWLTPADEYEFLTSLSSLGYIILMSAEPNN